MQIPCNYKFRLVGLSLGVIVALLVWPATRRIVWAQWNLSIAAPVASAAWSPASLGGSATSNTETALKSARRRFQETAARQPDDFPLQFANALAVPSPGESLTSEIKVRRLRLLAARFPDRPTLYAAILRFATQNQVRAERDEEDILTGPSGKHSRPVAGQLQNTPEQLAAFDRDAAEGERQDSDNAYFPLMRAIGLFAAHRDTEALAAMERAAQKPNWNEYYSAEATAEWKLQEETFGTVSALHRLAYAAVLPLPHYSELRTVSRVAIVKAVEAEQNGRTEEGFRIRSAVRTCGSLLRAQSVCVLGALVGVSIGQTALVRPGGAPPIARAPEESDRQVREQRGHAFDAYLQRIGHPEAISAVDAETAAGVQVREIAQFAVRTGAFEDPWKLTLSWIAAVALLSNVLWILALGAGTALVARHPRIRAGQGLPPSWRAGAAAGLFAGTLAAGIAILHPALPASALCLAEILFSSLLVTVLPGAKGSVRLSRLGAFGLSLLGTALLCSAFACQASRSIQPIVPFLWFLQEGDTALRMQWISAEFVGITAAIPLLTVFVLGALSRVWGVPLTVGIVRGLRGCAVPIACLLLLAYSLLVPITLHQESALEDRVQRTVQHEGRFMAEITGKRWPDSAH